MVLRTICFATAGFSSRYAPRVIVDDRRDDALHLRVAQLGLGLPLELRVRHLDADHRHEAFADVLAADALLQVGRQVVAVRVAVDRARERGPEPGQVRAAFLRVDVVGERVHRVGVAVVPLQRDLGVNAVAVAAHVDRRRVDGGLVLVDELDERADAAFVAEGALLADALVVQRDQDAAVEERELAQPVRQGVEAVLDRLEHLRVRLERHLGAAPLRRAGHFQRAARLPALVALAVHLPVAPDLDVQRLREGVDHGNAHAVEPARHLVALVVELAAGVEHRQHDLRGGLPALVLIDGNAAAVVRHGHGVVDVDLDADLVAEAGERLVYRVVDDLVDQVVQPGRAGRPDVHRRALADGLQSFEDADVPGVVGRTVRGRDDFGGGSVRGRRRARAVRLLVELAHQTRIGMMT